MISEPHFHARHRRALRKQIGRDAGRLVAHEIVTREVEQAQLVLRLAAAFDLIAVPALERGPGVDALRQGLIVKREDQFVIDEHILPARFVFELFDVGEQLAVMREERELRIELAFDERAANEKLARARRVLRAERDAAAMVDRQPEEHRTLERRHLRGPLFPMRL